MAGTTEQTGSIEILLLEDGRVGLRVSSHECGEVALMAYSPVEARKLAACIDDAADHCDERSRSVQPQ